MNESIEGDLNENSHPSRIGHCVNGVLIRCHFFVSTVIVARIENTSIITASETRKDEKEKERISISSHLWGANACGYTIYCSQPVFNGCNNIHFNRL
jgi:hypothetical protein